MCKRLATGIPSYFVRHANGLHLSHGAKTCPPDPSGLGQRPIHVDHDYLPAARSISDGPKPRDRDNWSPGHLHDSPGLHFFRACAVEHSKNGCEERDQHQRACEAERLIRLAAGEYRRDRGQL